MPRWLVYGFAYCFTALLGCASEPSNRPSNTGPSNTDSSNTVPSDTKDAHVPDVRPCDSSGCKDAASDVSQDGVAPVDAGRPPTTSPSSDTAPVLDAGAPTAGAPDALATATSSDTSPPITSNEPCEVVAPTSCPDPEPRWADIEPIVDRVCVVCHHGAIAGPWPLTTYQHVADWQNEIRGAMLNCNMPPPDDDVRITPAERALILEWLRCGLPR